MIWSIPVLQDTTIYENDPYTNTGLDQILEIRKSGDITTSNLTESRALVKFDLSNLSNTLTENNISINDISASLKLRTVQISELPFSYTIEAKALSKNWTNGSGYLTNNSGSKNTTITDGATWYSTSGTGSALWSSSLSPGTTILFNKVPGGGSWHTGSVVSQSFNFAQNDNLNIDVTSIVKNWYNAVYTNNGFLISFKNSEISASNYPNTNIQFYSSNTHTVHEPQLYITWTGSAVYTTGSMSVATFEDNSIVYVRAFKAEYLKDKKVRILLGARPKFPRPSFTQNSTFATMKALPVNSYYQIKDAHNDEIIIPFSQYTKVNTNSDGSYFDFYTTMMYPERYYKFEIKAEFTSITEYFSSNEFIFKIIE